MILRNAHGNLDLILVGNESRNKQRWGKADANVGLLLVGNGLGDRKKSVSVRMEQALESAE